MLRGYHFGRWLWVSTLAAAGLLAVAAAFAVARPAVSGPHGRQPVLSANDYQGTDMGGVPAADFRLLDQRGLPVALSDFRGKVVALAFLDPKCTDSCPLTAFHFRMTNQGLGSASERVVFLAVNVNPEAGAPEDVAEASEKWGIHELGNWYFVTGSEAELQPVWSAYRITARGGPKPNKPDEQTHTPGVFLVDQAGRLRRYISVPIEGWDGAPLNALLSSQIAVLLDENSQGAP